MMSLALVCGEHATIVDFSDLELGVANGTGALKSYTDSGVTINATTSGGNWETISAGIYAGLWFSQGTIADATYTIDFNGQAATYFEMAVDAMSATGVGDTEVCSEFSLAGAFNPAFVVSGIDGVTVAGTTLETLSFTTFVNDGKWRLAINAATPFTSITFRHTQNPSQNGSVIENIRLEIIPAPGAAGLALAGMGVAGLRRRR